MRTPLWNFPVSYGHVFLIFSLHCLQLLVYFQALRREGLHDGLMFNLARRRYAKKRRVLALAGYHVITISFGEVNKSFPQSTAVMQSVLVGECSRQQHRAFCPPPSEPRAGRTDADSGALGCIWTCWMSDRCL